MYDAAFVQLLACGQWLGWSSLSGGIVDAIAKIGVTQENNLLAGVRQGLSLMGAIKTVERKLVDGSFRHGGQALMTWCAGNARIVPTATGMRIARDDSGYGKIDPLMALFNASALMATNPTASAPLPQPPRTISTTNSPSS